MSAQGSVGVTLQAPSVQDAADIGLNVFALKLVAESMPIVAKNLRTMGAPPGSRVELILSAKDGSYWRLTLEPTTEGPTRGEGAL